MNQNAVIPKYAKIGDFGMDMVAVDIKHTKDYIEYETNIAVEIPFGFVGLLYPRSSISNKSLLMCNSVGCIDSGYRNSIKFRFQHTSGDNNSDYNIYGIGDKIGQLAIIPYPEIIFEEVEELSNSERGTGGFGHSGI
jgi:dUTP pyrophosphatase